MRLIALIVTVTLSGPAVSSLLCDVACAAKHRASTAAVGSCHEHGAPVSEPAVSAGHRCHDLVQSIPSILTTAQQLDLGVWAIVDALPLEIPDRSYDHPGAGAHGLTHGPPIASTPLRL